jgi:hypothetical protein
MHRLLSLLVMLAASAAIAQPPPPAPLATTSRDDIVRMLRLPHPERCLPFTVSTVEPVAVIRREGNAWIMRRLVLDRVAADRAARRAHAARRPWMPENEFAFLRAGPVVARGRSAVELARAIDQVATWQSNGLGPISSSAPRELCSAAR